MTIKSSSSVFKPENNVDVDLIKNMVTWTLTISSAQIIDSGLSMEDYFLNRICHELREKQIPYNSNHSSRRLSTFLNRQKEIGLTHKFETLPHISGEAEYRITFTMKDNRELMRLARESDVNNLLNTPQTEDIFSWTLTLTPDEIYGSKMPKNHFILRKVVSEFEKKGIPWISLSDHNLRSIRPFLDKQEEIGLTWRLYVTSPIHTHTFTFTFDPKKLNKAQVEPIIRQNTLGNRKLQMD